MLWPIGLIALWVCCGPLFGRTGDPIVFTPGTPSEKPYLASADGSMAITAGGRTWRFADGLATFEYRFHRDRCRAALLTVEMSGEFLVEARGGAGDWRPVMRSGLQGNADHHNHGFYQADLLPFFKQSPDVVVRFRDEDPSGGWGPSVYRIRLDFTPGAQPLPVPARLPGSLRIALMGWGGTLGRCLYGFQFDAHWLNRPEFLRTGTARAVHELAYQIFHPTSISLPDLARSADVVWMDAGAPENVWMSGAQSIVQFVHMGGALVVFGSWQTYGGAGGGGFLGTPLEEVLPVKLLGSPDKVDGPCRLVSVEKAPFMTAIPWQTCPRFNGHNRVGVKPSAHVAALWDNGDPAMVWWQYGKGRVFCFTSTPEGGWGPEVRSQWGGPFRLFVRSLLKWISEPIPMRNSLRAHRGPGVNPTDWAAWEDLERVWSTCVPPAEDLPAWDLRLRLAFELAGAARALRQGWMVAWMRQATSGRLWNGVPSWDYLPGYNDVPPEDGKKVPLERMAGRRLALAAGTAERLARRLHRKPAMRLARRWGRGLRTWLKPVPWPRVPVPHAWTGKPIDRFVDGDALYQQEPHWVMECAPIRHGGSPASIRLDYVEQPAPIPPTERRIPLHTEFARGVMVHYVPAVAKGSVEVPLRNGGDWNALSEVPQGIERGLVEEFFTTASTWFDEPPFYTYMTFFQEFRYGPLLIGRHRSLVWGTPALVELWRFENRGSQPVAAGTLVAELEPVPGRSIMLEDLSGHCAQRVRGRLVLVEQVPEVAPGHAKICAAIITCGRDPADLEKNRQAARGWIRAHVPALLQSTRLPQRKASPVHPTDPAPNRAGLWSHETTGFFHYLEQALLTPMGTYREITNQRSLWTDCDWANAARGLAYRSLFDRDVAARMRLRTMLEFLMACQSPSGAFASRAILDADGRARAVSLSAWCCSVAQCTYPLLLGSRVFASSDGPFASKCLEAAKRAGRWLIRDTDAKGELYGDDAGPRRDFGLVNDYPGDVHGLAVMDLCALYHATHDPSYLGAAKRIGRYLARHAREWVVNGNAIGGLCALWRATGYAPYLAEAEDVADHVLIEQSLDPDFQLVVAPQLDELDYAYRVWMLCDLAQAERLRAAQLAGKRQRRKAQEMLQRSWVHLGVADWVAQTFFGVNARGRCLQDLSGGSTWGNVEVTGMELSALELMDGIYREADPLPVW
ncbi:MAG: glutamine amidotransferase [Chthonomonadales bacterium]